jgi:glycolate oxidase FAD binding subunit
MLAPANESELSALLRDGGPVAVQAGGTKLHHAPGPAPTARSLSLKAFSKILFHEPGDLVVGVQAGIRLADLQAALARHGQWLPLDPPFADATVGGVLAANSSGPRRFGYGTVRDHLLGARVMGPGGASTRSGGKVVKNVTGYDLHKLHVGAFGTLGIVLEATFKLRPRPEISAVFAVPCRTLEEAHRFLLKVFDSRLRPVALEALDGRLKHLVEGDALALVAVEGSRPVIDRHYRELKELAPRLGLLEGPVADPLWTALRKLPEALRSYVRVRIGAKPHDLTKLVPSAPAWIQAGNGIARVDLEPDAETARKVRAWNERAKALGGYAVVESAPLDFEGRDKLPWGWTEQPLLKGLKNLHDPRRVLNPGRVPL